MQDFFLPFFLLFDSFLDLSFLAFFPLTMRRCFFAGARLPHWGDRHLRAQGEAGVLGEASPGVLLRHEEGLQVEAEGSEQGDVQGGAEEDLRPRLGDQVWERLRASLSPGPIYHLKLWYERHRQWSNQAYHKVPSTTCDTSSSVACGTVETDVCRVPDSEECSLVETEVCNKAVPASYLGPQ